MTAFRPTLSRPGVAPLAMIFGLMLGQALMLRAMGRIWICSCGTIHLWVGDIWSSELSQQVFDWYTFSHIVHGFLFYGLLRLAAPRLPVLARLAIAVGIEVTWEIAENSPWVIEAYRQQALAAGYTGDSILNSLMDNVSMMTGFAIARFFSWKATLAVALALEIGAAALVHDNLTLNVLNFVHRFPAIEAWQMRAQK